MPAPGSDFCQQTTASMGSGEFAAVSILYEYLLRLSDWLPKLKNRAMIDLHQVSCIYTDQGIPQEVEEYFKEKHIQVEKV